MKKAIIMLIAFSIASCAQGKAKIAVYDTDNKEFSKALLASLVKSCRDCQEIENHDAFLAEASKDSREVEEVAKKYGADLFIWLFMHPHENSTVNLRNLKTGQDRIKNGSIKLQGYSDNSLRALVAAINPKLTQAALGVLNQQAKEQENAQAAKEMKKAIELAAKLENKRRELIKNLWE
jgi:hypothetical protein